MCPFSYNRPAMPDPTQTLFVKCPNCGLIRELRWSPRGSAFPHHKPPMGRNNVKGRDIYWEQIDGTWQLHKEGK